MREDQIKEHLLSEDPEFRRLVEEHKLYEGQLNALHTRHRLTEQDHLENPIEKEKTPP